MAAALCCPCLRWRRRHQYESIRESESASYAQQQLHSPQYHYPSAAPAPGGGAAIVGRSSSGGADGSSSGSHFPQCAVSPVLPNGVKLPDWVSDETQVRCYGCAAAFDLMHRRHHCRRCRNVVCGACSANERPVLLAGLREPVRVCMRCSSEVARENHFIDTYLSPLLEGGEMALSRGLILGRRTPVRLLLAPSLDHIEIRDAAGASSAATATAPSPSPLPPIARIPLESISGVSEERGAVGLLVLVDGGKQHRLECAGPAQRALFTGAIREAAKLVPLMVGFKQRVEAEREQRARQELLAATERARRKETAARRQERQGFRNQIAQKYGLASKG